MTDITWKIAAPVYLENVKNGEDPKVKADSENELLRLAAQCGLHQTAVYMLEAFKNFDDEDPAVRVFFEELADLADTLCMIERVTEDLKRLAEQRRMFGWRKSM